MNKGKAIDYKKIVDRLSKANWTTKDKPWNYKTILSVAVESDNIDIVKDLLELGVDVNLVNSEGETVLFDENISVGMAQFLLEQHIDPNIRSNNGSLAYENHYENDDIILLLLPVSKFTKDELWLNGLISRLKYIKTVEEVLKCLKDKNIHYESETLLLSAALRPNNLEMILVLAKSGIDLHIRNEHNQDFYDLCFKNVQKVIRKEFPEFMEERKIRKDADKYNL